MRKPKFISSQADGMFEYHLPVPYSRFLDQLIFDNSNFRMERGEVDELLQFVAENAISSFVGWDENAVLYSLALETLAKDKTCMLVYFDQPDVITGMQEDANPQRIEWLSLIQFMEGMEYCTCFGIQSSVEFLEAAGFSDRNTTNRNFYLSEIELENLGLFPKLYHSDVTHWFFLFCEPENTHVIRSLLANEMERPTLETIQQYCFATANIQIGGDEGYLDYVLIQSRYELSTSIREIETKQNAFLEAYEELLKVCKPFDSEWKVSFYKERYREIMDRVRKLDS